MSDPKTKPVPKLVWTGEVVAPRKKWQHKYLTSCKEVYAAIANKDSRELARLLSAEAKTFKRKYVLRRLTGALSKALTSEILVKLGLEEPCSKKK